MEVKTKGKVLNNDADTLKLGGDIVLVGFSLEPVEMIVVKKIIGTYAKKIKEKTEYQEIKVTLKKTEKGKSFLHEVNVDVKSSAGLLTSNITNNNLYTALSEALEKIYNQADKE